MPDTDHLHLTNVLYRVMPVLYETLETSLVETFGAINRDPLVMQAFIPGVSEGDKRIILVDGEVAGAINRVPPKGHVRSNLRVGGVAEHEMRSVRDVVEAGGEVRRALFQQQPLTQIRPESAHVAQFQPIVRGGAHVDAQAAVGGGWLRCHVVASLLL